MQFPHERAPLVHISLSSVVKAVLAIAFCLLLYTLKNVALILLTAIVIASAVEPAALLCERKKIPRVVGVIAVYIVLILGLAALFYFILPTLLADTADFLSNLDTINLAPIFDKIGMHSSIGDMGGLLSLKDIIASLSDAISSLSGKFLLTASSLFGGALSFLIIIVLSFYLSVQKDGVADFLRIVTPAESEEYVVGLWKRSQKKIGLWMQGQILLGILVGLLDYLGLIVLGVPHALVLAVLAACLEILPVFGSVLAAVPGIAIAFSLGGVSLGLLTAGLYFIVQQFESNVVYPIVVNKVIGLSPVVVIIALLVGAELGGLIGAILAVPVATVLIEYIDDVKRHRAGLSKEVA